MTAPYAPPNIDDLISRYESGASLKQLAEEATHEPLGLGGRRESLAVQLLPTIAPVIGAEQSDGHPGIESGRDGRGQDYRSPATQEIGTNP